MTDSTNGGKASTSSSSSGCGRDLFNLPSKDELKKLLECPVCLEIPLPPIIQCKDGHSICSRCRKKLKRCRLCLKTFTECRNFLHENIVESSQFRCDFSEDGCGKVILGSMLGNHLEECKFRPFKCHVDWRDGEFKYSEYLEHQKTVHEAIVLEAVNGSFSRSMMLKLPWCVGTITCPSAHVEFDGQHFLTYTSVSGSIVYLCVLFFGEAEEASNYTVQISVGTTWQAVAIVLRMPVISCRKTEEEILRLGVLTLTQGTLQLVGNTNENSLTWITNYKLVKKCSLPLPVIGGTSQQSVAAVGANGNTVQMTTQPSSNNQPPTLPTTSSA